MNSRICRCGCGANTSLITKTCKKRGYVKGGYLEFIHGHNPKPWRDEEALFWGNLDKKDSGCWEWSGKRNEQGYGRLWFRGKQIRAHRLSWSLINGLIPEGLDILHKCDNPSCCNPNHLYSGTDKDNANDRQARGRLIPRKGEDHHKSLLTWNQIGEIREFCENNPRSQRITAKRYGVKESVISKIVNGVTWKE